MNNKQTVFTEEQEQTIINFNNFINYIKNTYYASGLVQSNYTNNTGYGSSIQLCVRDQSLYNTHSNNDSVYINIDSDFSELAIYTKYYILSIITYIDFTDLLNKCRASHNSILEKESKIDCNKINNNINEALRIDKLQSFK